MTKIHGHCECKKVSFEIDQEIKYWSNNKLMIKQELEEERRVVMMMMNLVMKKKMRRMLLKIECKMIFLNILQIYVYTHTV